jgi:hypothetical protein
MTAERGGQGTRELRRPNQSSARTPRLGPTVMGARANLGCGGWVQQQQRACDSSRAGPPSDARRGRAGAAQAQRSEVRPAAATQQPANSVLDGGNKRTGRRARRGATQGRGEWMGEGGGVAARCGWLAGVLGGLGSRWRIRGGGAFLPSSWKTDDGRAILACFRTGSPDLKTALGEEEAACRVRSA